jgi:ERCC4-type nuclease
MRGKSSIAGGGSVLTIDARVGSRELMHYFPEGLAELGHLQFGDASFVGNGPEGCPVLVGIERKELQDMLKSILDGRFAGHQLPGLLRDYHQTYLIVEGKFRADPNTGLLQTPFNKGWRDHQFGTKRWLYRDLDCFLMTMENRYNIRVRRTFDKRETALLISNIHHWWTDKAFEEHKAGQGFDYSGEPILLPASLLRRMAAQLPGIGWKRAQAVEQFFGSVVDMVLAPSVAWRQIPGIGATVAGRVVEAMWRQKK